MRRTIVALTAIFLAPTAVLASATGGKLAGNSELGAAAAIHQIVPGAMGQQDLLGGKLILAKGDQKGDGPGVGGQKGQKKGGNKGKLKEGKDNKDKKS